VTAPSARDALLAAGVEDPERLLARFAALWPAGGVPEAAATALFDAADPELAVAGLGRLRDAAPLL